MIQNLRTYMRYKIRLMMALDNQAFNLVEHDGFIGLIAHLQPRYLISNIAYFSKNSFRKCMRNSRKL